MRRLEAVDDGGDAVLDHLVKDAEQVADRRVVCAASESFVSESFMHQICDDGGGGAAAFDHDFVVLFKHAGIAIRAALESLIFADNFTKVFIHRVVVRAPGVCLDTVRGF